MSKEQAVRWAGPLKLAEGPKVYPKERLYELLDGGADSYVQAGVRAVLFARFGRDDKTVCRLMLFSVTSPKQARILAKAERPEGGSPVRGLGEAAWRDAEGLVGRKGRIVVRVDPDEPGAKCPYRELAERVFSDPKLPW